MIPKNLFFIWITEPKSPTKELPDFGKYAAQKFKEVNPDFNVIQIFNDSPYLKECQEYMRDKNIIPPCGMYNEIVRLYMIYKYGGIYLDYDCFPVKPFDDKLLSYDFIKSRYDIYALGSKPRDLSELTNSAYKDNCYENTAYFPLYQYFVNPKFANGLFKDVFNKNNYIELKEKFRNCTLQYGEKMEPNSTDELYYVDHYRMSVWNNDTVVCRTKEDIEKYV